MQGKGCLDQADFHDRFEKEILREDTMDGTRQGGKYGWTDALLSMGKARDAKGMIEASLPGAAGCGG